MKKEVKLSIAILLISASNLLSQGDLQNLRKYWFYRYRLVNDFMVKGPDCQGCSEIINEREHKGDNVTSPTPLKFAKWGDQSFNMGEYISVLATEFKLLHDAGEPTDTTLQELCYALRAFNRIDQHGEHYYAVAKGIVHPVTSGDLDGRWVRDDVPSDFLDQHPQLKDGLFSTHPVEHVSSDYQDAIDQAPNFSGKTFWMSHDQIYPVLMGMALIRRYMYDEVNYNNYPLNDVNGNTNIYKEAEDITDRIINSLHNSVLGLDWTVQNPFFPHASSNPIITPWDDIQGFQAAQFAYPISEAGCYIKNMNTNPDFGYPVHTCSDYHDGSSFNLAESWNDLGKPYVYPISTLTYEDYKAQLLVTIGNSWWSHMFPTVADPVSVVTTILSLDWPPTWHDVTTVIAGAIGLPTNVTEYELYLHTKKMNNQHLSLLRMLLHGGGNPFPPSEYQALLNVAPCEGPYNFSASGGGMSTYEWSSRDRLHVADERGGYGYSSDNGDGSSQGEYPGLDYMLYYNLYAIAYGPGSGVSYTNYMDRKITFPFPITYPGGSIGSHATPVTIEAFNTIDANNIVNSTAEVTYRAGRQIHLGPGFHAATGSTFHAYIDPFECAEGEYRSTTATNNNNLLNEAVAYTGHTTFVKYPEHGDSMNEKNPEPETVSQDQSYSETPQMTGNYSENNQVNTFSGIIVYPNPNNGNFTVEVQTNEPNLISTLTVSNIYGRTFLTQQLTNLTTVIDISDQAKGIYFVKVENKKGIQTEKIIYQ